jgi:LysM repeat protein
MSTSWRIQRFLAASLRKSPVFYWQIIFFVLIFLLPFYYSRVLYFSKNQFNESILSGKDNNLIVLSQRPNLPLIFFDNIFLNENSVKAINIAYLPSFNILGTIFDPEKSFSREGVLEYVVKKDETIEVLAERFNISVQTILWANNLSPKSILKEGDKILILPVSGVLHYVKPGETLSQIAKSYKVALEKIAQVNNLSLDEQIFVGDALVIPDAKPLPQNKTNEIPLLPLADNLFICPLGNSCRITQGLHWYNAVDFSNGFCGEPVFAVAGGKVQNAGYHQIAGKYVRLVHNSGISTFYGHLSAINVKVGQDVSQGQIIGYVGHTGYTIPAGPAGCHVHFEVRGARNPFAK